MNIFLKKMKTQGNRPIAVVVALMIMICMISGCQTSTQTTEATTQNAGTTMKEDGTTAAGSNDTETVQDVVVWEMYGPDREMDKLAEEFNDSQGTVKVTDEYIPGHTELMQKLQVVASSGTNLPDCILIDMFYAPVINQMVDLVDLTPYLADDPDIKIDDFYPELANYSNIDDKQISLHAYANNLILYYNKQLFTDAGLDPETPPESWDELVEYAQKLTKEGQWGFHMSAFSDSYYETVSWQYEVMVWQNGGEMWDENWQPKFNSPEGIEALQFMKDLIYKYKVSTVAPPENGFQQGKIAMLLEGTWMGNEFSENLGENLGAAQLPYSVEPATNTGGEHWMIVSSNDDRQLAAWQYLSFMLSEDSVTRICSNGGQVPTRISISESESFKAFAAEHLAIQTSMDAMPTARMRAASPNYGPASEALSGFLQQAIYDQLSAEDALEQAEAAFAEKINQ